MTPAMPPLPTASYFRFHWAGSHSSKLASGRTTPATRQNAGTLRAGAPGAAFGRVIWPAGIFAADLIAMPGSESLVRLSQDGCAAAGIAVTSSPVTNNQSRATIARRNMNNTPPRLAAMVPRASGGCQCCMMLHRFGTVRTLAMQCLLLFIGLLAPLPAHDLITTAVTWDR